jgi:hypothetical protein
MNIDLPHISLAWDIDESDTMTGVGALAIDGVAQMCTAFPAPFILQSPDGWDYRRFRVLDTSAADDCTVVRTTALGTAADHSWYRDQYDYDILQVGRPRTAPALEVDFILRPVTETHGGVAFHGVHLSWAFRSEGARLARLRWMQHWEIDGDCSDTTLYWQSQIAAPVAKLTCDAEWDNVCWKSLQRDKTDSNVSMQMNARAAYHQLFDFHCAPQGVFLAYFPTPQTVQTLCRKNPSETEYHVAESIEFPVADSGEIPGKTILFATGAGQTEAAQKNLWFTVNAHLEDSYRTQTGVVKSRNLPTRTHWMHGAVPTADHVYYDPYRRGDRVPAERYLEWLGQNEMPKVAAQGFRRFWTRPYCRSDASEMMFWNKSMQGQSIMDGDVTIGSCCCVQEYVPSDMYGGGDMAKRFYELGHENGLDIGIWVGNHLSTRAPILKEHPDWVLKDRNFANPAGGYDDLIMAVVNWNSGARDWILAALLAWKEEYGLDFIFFDSLGNLGLKTRNFTRPDLADNFEGIMGFAADLTQAGIEIICEGRSFIGAPHFGISNDGNMASESDPLRGQNSLGWYLGHEDMFCGIEAFCNRNKKRVDAQKLINMHFRILATGGLLDVNGGPEELHAHQHIVNQVAEFMQDRVLLEDDQGVLWRGAGKQVFFAFRDGVSLPVVGGGRASQVRPEGPADAGAADEVIAAAGEVFLIGL